jgi:hypothetical protein
MTEKTTETTGTEGEFAVSKRKNLVAVGTGQGTFYMFVGVTRDVRLSLEAFCSANNLPHSQRSDGYGWDVPPRTAGMMLAILRIDEVARQAQAGVDGLIESLNDEYGARPTGNAEL